ncbi:MAG: S1C family serine protease, partial [Spirochaetaceae bacterium]|nr:S1C family serine protease [Spirochaetaceae bacterium]
MRNFFLIVKIIFVSLLLSTCITPKESQGVPLEKPRDNLYFQELLYQGQISLGLQYLYLGTHDLDSQNQSEMKSVFLQALKEKIPQMMDQGEWELAFQAYQSLSFVDPSEVEDYSRESFIYGRIIQLFEQNAPAAAATLLVDELDLQLIDDESLRNLENLFIQSPQVSAIVNIVDQLKKRGLEPRQSSLDLVAMEPSKEELINGTVTLWVDRGIKMQNGVGLPDRIIGSGFFIDNQGYLLTNYHVIASEVDPQYEGYSKLYIKRNDREGEKIPARVVGWDPVMDLALIKTEMSVPYSFTFTRDILPRLGENLFAIGSPGGLEKTLTSGSVSSLARYLM